jgi:hypothetical protein
MFQKRTIKTAASYEFLKISLFTAIIFSRNISLADVVKFADSWLAAAVAAEV